MTHNQLQILFIAWFQEENPEARIFVNNSGKAKINKKLWIPYGMPSSGGGSDLMAFYPGGFTEFYEVKTIAYPDLSQDQVKVANLMIKLGFEYYIIRESKEKNEWFEIIPYK